MSRARDLADRVLHNRTHEDTDGGRESIVTFKGEQSGGEISTLAQIQASHDGTSDDQKADLIFKTNDGSDNAAPTEAMRIDSGQNVLIGKTDAETTISGGTPAFQLTGAGVDSSLAVTRREANQYGPTLFLSKSRNTTPNNYTIVQNNDSLGTIAFIGDDGTNLDTYGASISAEVDGTAGANDLPTRLKFSVTHDGASTPTEKIRIDEDGLKFNGDTAEANALNDYEEGTWTPKFTDSTNDVTLSNGSESNGGFYTKIGNMVVASFGIYNVSISSLSGTLLIKTLPFTFKATGLTAGIMFIAGTSGGSNVPIIMYPVASSANVILYKAVSSTQNLSSLGTSDLGSNVSVRMNLTYFTDA